MWREYVWGGATLAKLAEEGRMSVGRVRRILDNYEVRRGSLKKARLVMMDTIYFDRKWGILLAVEAETGSLVGCREVQRERVQDYVKMVQELKMQGFEVEACVVDGVVPVGERLEEIGVKVQYCQFHQMRRALSVVGWQPKSEVERELKELVLHLKDLTEEEFGRKLQNLKVRYRKLLEEKVRNPATGRLKYLRPELRRAVRELERNGRFLFTYQEYPELAIPRTNNRLEGLNGMVKSKLNQHRGAKRELKVKMVKELLKY